MIRASQDITAQIYSNKVMLRYALPLPTTATGRIVADFLAKKEGRNICTEWKRRGESEMIPVGPSSYLQHSKAVICSSVP